MSRMYFVLPILLLATGSCMGQFGNAGAIRSAEQKVSSLRSMDEIQSDIDDLTSDVTCSEDSQCKIAQYGIQSCGGPSHLQLYSDLMLDESQLNALMNEFNSVNQKHNEQYQSMGICSLLQLPNVACVNNGCAEVP